MIYFITWIMAWQLSGEIKTESHSISFQDKEKAYSFYTYGKSEIKKDTIMTEQKKIIKITIDSTLFIKN